MLDSDMLQDNDTLVSVIVPVYNCERYLAEAIESILAQTYRPIEIIVIDDGSTDNTSIIAKGFGDKVRYFYHSNSGPAVARNKGLEKARGDYIAFLDQDDLWIPNKLSCQMEHLLKHPEIGYVISKQSIFLEPGTKFPSWLKKEILDNEQAGFLPSTLLCRKSVFERIGIFDPAYSTTSDVDWFFRAKDAGIQKFSIPEVLTKRRIHCKNQSYDTKVLNNELLRISMSSIRRQRANISGKRI